MAPLRIHVTGHEQLVAAVSTVATASGLQIVPTVRRAEVVVRCHNGSPGPWLAPGDLDDLPRCDITVGELLSVHHARVGPLSIPGCTACPGCLAAHENDRGRIKPLGAVAHPDPALVWTACALAVRELLGLDRLLDAADSPLPVTWDSAILIGPREVPMDLPVARHPHCGCTWADFMEA